MQQQEIQFFWPLTEQIPLDLDYSSSIKYQEEKQKQFIPFTISAIGGSWATGKSSISSTFEFKSNPESVGYWEVSEHVHVWRENKPRWVVRIMSRFLLGWKWMDK